MRLKYRESEVMKSHFSEDCAKAVLICARCDLSFTRGQLVNHDCFKVLRTKMEKQEAGYADMMQIMMENELRLQTENKDLKDQNAKLKSSNSGNKKVKRESVES